MNGITLELDYYLGGDWKFLALTLPSYACKCPASKVELDYYLVGDWKFLALTWPSYACKCPASKGHISSQKSKAWCSKRTFSCPAHITRIQCFSSATFKRLPLPRPYPISDFPFDAILIGAICNLAVNMPHNCCVPQCCKYQRKGSQSYFSQDNSANCAKRKWIHAIQHDGKHFKLSQWMKICLLHFQPSDFYNYWSSCPTLREDAVPSILPFNSKRVSNKG